MNILIVGSGKTARRAALELMAAGHQAAVLCQDRSCADALTAAGFDGSVTMGEPTDLKSMEAAGIKDCDALVSCTDNDNTNIMVSEMAKEYFDIDTMLTCVVDVDREDVYQEYGLDTVCPTRLVADAIVSSMAPEKQQRQTAQFGTCTMGFESRTITDLMDGRYTDEYKLPKNCAVIGVQHADNRITMIKNERVLMVEGERLIIARIVD